MIPARELRFAEGEMLLVNKPAGWTSFDVVNRIRRLTGVRKAGHAGTLDPMATGLMIVCTGKMTKTLGMYVGLEKEYRVRMVLGARTDSFDAGTPVIERRSTDDVTAERVREVLESFVGPQSQVPPMWSAIKMGGRRLYELARKGIRVDRPPREVIIRSITPLEIAVPLVTCVVVCSKGTYIRALVNDIGDRIGCGAYVEMLERTGVGDFRLEDALSMEELAQYCAERREQTA